MPLPRTPETERKDLEATAAAEKAKVGAAKGAADTKDDIEERMAKLATEEMEKLEDQEADLVDEEVDPELANIEKQMNELIMKTNYTAIKILFK